MTPKQQSILAAEILGWEKKGCSCGCARPWVAPDAHLGVYEWQLPAFHSDANAALQLVEWMQKTRKLFLVWTSYLGKASFYEKDLFSAPEVVGTATHDSFSLAILGAFLRANGKEVE